MTTSTMTSTDIYLVRYGTVPEVARFASESPELPARGTDVVVELQKLAALKEQGILSDEEFAAAKAKLLGV